MKLRFPVVSGRIKFCSTWRVLPCSKTVSSSTLTSRRLPTMAALPLGRRLWLASKSRMEARMCLSIPAKITEIKQGGFPLMGIVDFGGVSREICLDYVPEAQVGQYALIHVGFAIS